MAPPKGFIPWNKGKPGRVWTEEQRKKASQSHMGNPSNSGRKFSPEHCENISKGLRAKNIKRTPEFKRNLSEKYKTRFFTPEWRARISESLRGKPSGRKGIPMSEETKQKLRAVMLGKNSGPDSYLWNGGSSIEPYCVKFSRKFKERVRHFFNNKCVECGRESSGRKLHVHHVNFDKMSCCNDTIPLFVPLCISCHMKTNFNREYWEEHFTKIINEKYGGKCYFSDEEFTEYLLSAK